MSGLHCAKTRIFLFDCQSAAMFFMDLLCLFFFLPSCRGEEGGGGGGGGGWGLMTSMRMRLASDVSRFAPCMGGFAEAP